MGMINRHPKCGCDCRHDGTGTEHPTVCCDQCGGDRAPTFWFVYVPCDVNCGDDCLLGAGGGRRVSVLTGSDPIYVYGFPLAPHCMFDNCRWLAIWTVKNSCPGQYPNALSLSLPEIEYSAPTCGEWGVLTTYPDDFAWELVIEDGIMKMSWTHPTYGHLEYSSNDPVDCNGNNNLYLTSAGTATCLPGHLCVYPMVDYPCCCDVDNGVEGGCFSVDDCYAEEADRCSCCDQCCDCFNVAVNGDCSGTPVTSSGQACVGGRTGLSDPAGVSREYCFNVNDGYGSHEICLVFYCNGTEWKLDVYCDGVFDSEGTVGEHLCCPLRFTFTFTVACLECSFCGCVGEDDCDCDPATCCDLEGSTFNVTVTPRAGCSCTTPVTFTITDSITPGVWMGNTTVCGDAFSISGLSCENGTWSILGGVPALGCGYSDDAISEVVCPDLLVNFVADCGACIFDIEVSN